MLASVLVRWRERGNHSPTSTGGSCSTSSFTRLGRGFTLQLQRCTSSSLLCSITDSSPALAAGGRMTSITLAPPPTATSSLATLSSPPTAPAPATSLHSLTRLSPPATAPISWLQHCSLYSSQPSEKHALTAPRLRAGSPTLLLLLMVTLTTSSCTSKSARPPTSTHSPRPPPPTPGG